MNEPKKRGRPSKALVEALAKTKNAVAAGPLGAAQAYALRIWNKQSISLSRHERVGRIAAALKEQGLSMEGVELP